MIYQNAINNTYDTITSIIDRSSRNPKLKNNLKLKNDHKQDIEFYVTLLDKSINWSKDFAKATLNGNHLRNYKLIFEET